MMAVDVTITKAQMIRLLENYREERESISQILRHLSQDIEGFYQPSSQGSIDEAGVKVQKQFDQAKQIEQLLPGDKERGGTEVMKIEDMQTLPEFFGVEAGNTIRIDDKSFTVLRDSLVQQGTQAEINAHTETWFRIQGGRALVGCLTGQLEWSKYEPKMECKEVGS